MVARDPQTPHVLVVGDVMLDCYLMGRCERISPEAPVPVVSVGEEHESLGGAANVAQNLLALGAKVTLAAVVGNDAEGRRLRELLSERGAGVEALIVVDDRPTTSKTRVLAQHQQLVRLDREICRPIGGEDERRLLQAALNPQQPYDAVLLSDYAKGVVVPAVSQAVIEWARQRRLPVLADPKGQDGSKYRRATLITPNRKEAAQLAGRAIPDDVTLSEVGEELRQRLELAYAVITLSDEGLALFDGTMRRLPTSAREVYDVSGAGDTVLASLGYGLACGWPLVDAARLANDAAAVVVGKVGTAVATWPEIHRHRVRETTRPPRGIVPSADELESTVRDLQRSGKRVVFTNGCFDLLHRGHIEYLAASKQCGDVLVVAVNSDRSIRSLKGAGRPIVDQQDRCAILAALEAVDLVYVFDEETPYELIRRLSPDVLTKGADYTREQVVGADLVADVRLIPVWTGRSTSNTVKQIQAAA